MKGCVFNTVQIPQNWIQKTYNEGVFWYMNTSHTSANKFYNDLVRVETGLSFSDASNFFTENFTNNIEYFDILEKTKPKEEVLDVLEYCYCHITTCGAMVRIAKALLGENIRISFFLEEIPIRIVFDGAGDLYTACLTVPNNKRVLMTPNGIGLIAVDILRQIETEGILREFFTQFVPPEEYVIFEFN